MKMMQLTQRTAAENEDRRAVVELRQHTWVLREGTSRCCHCRTIVCLPIDRLFSVVEHQCHAHRPTEQNRSEIHAICPVLFTHRSHLRLGCRISPLTCEDQHLVEKLVVMLVVDQRFCLRLKSPPRMNEGRVRRERPTRWRSFRSKKRE